MRAAPPLNGAAQKHKLNIQGTSLEAPMIHFPLRVSLHVLTGLTALLLAALAGAQPASLPSSQSYVGGGLQPPRPKPGTVPGAGVDVPQTGLTLQSNAEDRRASEWKVYGRYQFTETWGAEVLYADKGRRNAQAAGAAGTISPTTSLWNLAASGSVPLARGFSLTGKVGLARSDIYASPYCLSAACGPVISGRRQVPFAGVGLGYSFSDAWGMRFDYENASTLRLDGAPNNTPTKGDSWSARIRYTF
jgi:hypothetical protein